jgi:hypothetical protein
MMVSAVIALLTAAPPPLSLEAATPQSDVIVGEPIKLTLRWKAKSNMAIDLEDNEFVSSPLTFRVRRVDAPYAVEYREHPRGAVEGYRYATELLAGQDIVTSIVLIRGTITDGRRGFVFESPGRHTLTVIYRFDRGAAVESNPITFVVRDPTGDEIQVLSYIKGDPALLENPESPLIDKHRDSRYLAWARVRGFQERARRLANGYDVVGGVWLTKLAPAELEAAKSQRLREMAQDLWSGGGWGQFEEDRLYLTYRFASEGSDKRTSEAAKEEIQRRFPRSRSSWVIDRDEREAAEARADDEGDMTEAAEITICHLPPGDPSGRHTIRIGASAWPAHSSHGDTRGPCQ